MPDSHKGDEHLQVPEIYVYVWMGVGLGALATGLVRTFTSLSVWEWLGIGLPLWGSSLMAIAHWAEAEKRNAKVGKDAPKRD